MDPPLADTFHKENLHFGGGIPTIMWESIKANPACKEIKHALPDDELFDDWSLQGMKCCSWTLEDKENFYKKQALSEKIASVTGVSVSELEQPILSDNEGYDINDPDLHNPRSPPGNLSSFYTAKELDDPLGVSGMVLDEYPLPELKLEDDFCLDNDNIIDDREACALLAELEKILLNKIDAKEALKKK